MKTRIQDGMIRFEFDEAVLQTIEKALGDMKGQSRKVLKNAVNATAKQARSDLADKALAAGVQIDKFMYLPVKTRFNQAKYEKNIDEELKAVSEDMDKQFAELGV